MSISRWKLGVGATALAIAAAFAAAAYAATTGSTTYTGCVSTTGGISKVAAGATPIGTTCPSGSSPIVLSGGDITAVAASTGLSGGATLGTATLSVASSYRLPQSCAAGQVARSNGAGGWACFSGPKAISLDIAASYPETLATVDLPYGFHLRLHCTVQTSAAGWTLDAASDAAGDVNYAATIEDDATRTSSTTAFGYGLPSGAAFVYVESGSNPFSTIRAEGQLVLHAGAHITTVTFHVVGNISTGRCQLTGVATPAS